MSHYVSSKPFYILRPIAGPVGFFYSANVIGREIEAPDTLTLEEFDTEQEIADRADELIGEVGWYWKCDNRIPYPPNPNDWTCEEEE